MTVESIRAAVEAGVTALEAERLHVAELSRELAVRELSSRLLRNRIETDLRQSGLVKTDAEKQAKVDPEYLEYESDTIAKAYERSVSEAKVEVLKYQIILGIGDLQRTWAEDSLNPATV